MRARMLLKGNEAAVAGVDRDAWPAPSVSYLGLRNRARGEAPEHAVEWLRKAVRAQYVAGAGPLGYPGGQAGLDHVFIREARFARDPAPRQLMPPAWSEE